MPDTPELRSMGDATKEKAMWAAFRWVGDLLRALAPEAPSSPDRPGWPFFRRPARPALADPSGPPPDPGSWPALAQLAEVFRLHSFECDLLLLCAALELDLELASLCGRLHPDGGHPCATLELAIRVFSQVR